jgi:PAS domain S-box-containing protein
VKEPETNETTLRNLADSVPIGVLSINSIGECLFSNKSWTKLTDFTEAESNNLGWLQVIHPHSLLDFDRKFVSRLKECQEVEYEVEIVTPNGLVKWLSFKGSPVLADQTENPTFWVVASDVTEQKGSKTELRESEERFRKIINRASDMIFEVAPDGTFAFTNPVVEKILQYRDREIVGKHFLEIVHPSHRKSVVEFYSDQLKKRLKQTYFELPVVSKSGKKHWIGQNVTLTLRNGRVSEIQGFAREITAQKLAERSLLIQDAVVRLLAQADSVDGVIHEILKAVGSILGWQCGAWWRFNTAHNGLVCESFWKEQRSEFRRFARATRAMSFEFGEGIPGTVLRLKESIWVEDLAADSRFIRSEICRAEGLKSGFWFPVLLGNSVHGVFEFVCSNPEPIDHDLMLLVSNIGSQIGQFIERKRAERELRESDARKSAILESALDCIITIDYQGKGCRIQPRGGTNVWLHKG